MLFHYVIADRSHEPQNVQVSIQYMQAHAIHGNVTVLRNQNNSSEPLQNRGCCKSARSPLEKKRFHPRPSFSPRFVCLSEHEAFGRSPFLSNQATLRYTGRITKYRTALYDV